jgi:hypothetical protein
LLLLLLLLLHFWCVECRIRDFVAHLEFVVFCTLAVSNVNAVGVKSVFIEIHGNL